MPPRGPEGSDCMRLTCLRVPALKATSTLKAGQGLRASGFTVMCSQLHARVKKKGGICTNVCICVSMRACMGVCVYVCVCVYACVCTMLVPSAGWGMSGLDTHVHNIHLFCHGHVTCHCSIGSAALLWAIPTFCALPNRQWWSC